MIDRYRQCQTTLLCTWIREKDYTTIAAIPQSAHTHRASAWLWHSLIVRAPQRPLRSCSFLSSLPSDLCGPSVRLKSLWCFQHPWDTRLFTISGLWSFRSCDHHYIFSRVLAAWSLRVMSGQWEQQNNHSKKHWPNCIFILHFVLCNSHMPYNLNIQNISCWKKKLLYLRKEIIYMALL